jgi:hypothetical protein
MKTVILTVSIFYHTLHLGVVYVFRFIARGRAAL